MHFLAKTAYPVLLWGCIGVAVANANNYVPASVTHTSGQVKTGTIHYGNWGETPQTVKFRDTQGRESILGAKEIKAFEVTRRDGAKEYYELKTVSVNRSPRKLADLDYDPKPRMVLDTVFLQVQLITPDLTLYNLNQSGVNHLFIKQDSVYELIQKQYRTIDGGGQKYLENNRYRQQLLSITQGTAPALNTRILKTAYTTNAIRRLLADFTALQQKQIRYKFSRESDLFGLTLAMGVVHSDFAYVGNTRNTDILKSYTFAATNTITPTVTAVWYFPQTRQRLSLAVDAGIRNTRDTVVYDKRRLPNVVLEPVESQDFNLTHLRIHIGPRFQIQSRGIRVFIQPGISLGRIVNNKSKETYRKIDFLTGRYEVLERPLFTEAKKHEIATALTLGLGYRRWQIEARYDRGNGFSPYQEPGIKTYNYSLFLGYKIL